MEEIEGEPTTVAAQTNTKAMAEQVAMDCAAKAELAKAEQEKVITNAELIDILKSDGTTDRGAPVTVEASGASVRAFASVDSVFATIARGVGGGKSDAGATSLEIAPPSSPKQKGFAQRKAAALAADAQRKAAALAAEAQRKAAALAADLERRRAEAKVKADAKAVADAASVERKRGEAKVDAAELRRTKKRGLQRKTSFHTNNALKVPTYLCLPTHPPTHPPSVAIQPQPQPLPQPQPQPRP